MSFGFQASESEKLMFHRGFVAGRNSLAISPDMDIALQIEVLQLRLDETQMKLIVANNTIEGLLGNGTALGAAARRAQTAAVDASNAATHVIVRRPSAPVPSQTSGRFSPPTHPSLPPILEPHSSSDDIARLHDVGYYDLNSEYNASLTTTLDELFVNAHVGSERSHALVLVKALCRQAHSTPDNEKTPGMRYVLSNWRKPVEGGSPGMINPRENDSTAYWAQYLTQHPGSWPKGVRKDSVTGKPNIKDLEGSRILAKLRPASDAPSTLRSEFICRFLELFLEEGMYRRLVERGLQVQSHGTCHHFIWTRTEEPTAQDIAHHVARCGMTVNKVEEFVEPFAYLYAMATHR